MGKANTVTLVCHRHPMPPSLAEQHQFLDYAKSFNFQMVRALVEQDPTYTNVQPSGRWTALHQACYTGDAGMVKFLLDRGADVKVTTRDKQTPADVAVQQGHPNVKALLDAATAAQSPSKAGKSKASASNAPPPKSQKVAMKGGVAQTKFDASGAASDGKMVVKGRCAVDPSCP